MKFFSVLLPCMLLFGTVNCWHFNRAVYKYRSNSFVAKLYSTFSNHEDSISLKQRPVSNFLPSSINLLKNCVGSGVFSLNARVNAITSDPSQYPAVYSLIFLMAVWGIHNFYIIGETCKLTGKITFAEAWTESVSKSSQKFVTFVITVAPIVSCIASTIVLADVFKLFLRVIGIPAGLYLNRGFVVSTLTAFILYPLCISKNLSALKNVSIIGLLGQFIAMSAIFIRLLDGSYRLNGLYYQATSVPKVLVQSSQSIGSNSFYNLFNGVVSKWFVFASLLAFCFVTHYNVKFFYFVDDIIMLIR
jgi:hypothetical protein